MHIWISIKNDMPIELIGKITQFLFSIKEKMITFYYNSFLRELFKLKSDDDNVVLSSDFLFFLEENETKISLLIYDDETHLIIFWHEFIQKIKKIL